MPTLRQEPTMITAHPYMPGLRDSILKTAEAEKSEDPDVENQTEPNVSFS